MTKSANDKEVLKVEISKLPATEQQIKEIIDGLMNRFGDACSEPKIISTHHSDNLGSDRLYLYYQLELFIYDTHNLGGASVIQGLKEMGYSAGNVKQQFVTSKA